ncbi:MAG: NADH-quinone oxidoreductase subunit L [Lachnospiraceae bacterium]|nr:NADH-quinone oxidoreductase subunit L [Lachnospiraceae bacterium]
MSVFQTSGFLILFPFVVALLVVLQKKDTRLRRVTVIGNGFLIMAAAVYTAVCTLMDGQEILFKPSSEAALSAAENTILVGEIFLLLVVTVLSIRYKKYYCILIGALGTCPILAMDFLGLMPEHETYLRLDPLAAVMYLIAGVVGPLICMYAVGYMSDYHHHHTDVQDRTNVFLALLFVFLGGMFGLITSDNLVWVFFFWEITSVCSFLLIGYTRSPEAVNNSFRALWMNLLGGVGFSAGILVLFWMDENHISSLSELNHVGIAGPVVMLSVTLFAFAALTKSAQFPFSRWLLGAMVAPTPSSALLHSATMVKIGVYMLIRLSPQFYGTFTGVMITVLGGFTFFAASLLAISQSDGKKVLAYSTISNLGLITACAGTGTTEGVWAAVMLMLFHAVSKSLLFQTVGDIENNMGSRDIEDMHGLVIKLPRLALIMMIGICGMFMAPFGMLVSKWAALKAFVDSQSVWLVLFLVFGSGSTLFYWAKWLGKICTVIHQSVNLEDETHGSELISMVPLTGLIVVMCFAFPLMSNTMVQPVLNTTFNKIVPNVIGGSDVIIMMIMVTMIFLVPLGSRFLSVGAKDKMTMSYVAGVNAGDDRHYIDSFGKSRSLYLANWYMEDYFGEKRLLMPCVGISAILVILMVLIVMGGVF